MGVSGSGKTTVGKLLREHTGWNFYDADDFHPAGNISKMSHGIPLNDRDRKPWLIKLKSLIDTTISKDKSAILACSALKLSYREILDIDRPEIVLIYLQGNYEQILARLKQRQEHFMHAEMLRSQFKILEEPQADLIVDISLSPEAIVEQIIKYLD